MLFQKISGSEKKLRDKRGGVSRFSVENFYLTMPKIFIGEPFCAVFQKNSGSEKVYGLDGRGWGIKIFRRKFSVSGCRKISLGNPSVPFQKISGSEKSSWIRGGGGASRFSAESFCITVTKNSVEESFSLSLI